MSILKNSLYQALAASVLSASLCMIPQAMAGAGADIDLLCVSPESMNIVRTERKPRPNGEAMAQTLRNQRDAHEELPDPTKVTAYEKGTSQQTATPVPSVSSSSSSSSSDTGYMTEADIRNLAVSGSSKAAKLILKYVAEGKYPAKDVLKIYSNYELSNLDLIYELTDNYRACRELNSDANLPDPTQFMMDLLKESQPDVYNAYADFQSAMKENLHFDGKYRQIYYDETGKVLEKNNGRLSIRDGMLHNENDDIDFIYGYHLKDQTIYFYDEEEEGLVGYYLQEDVSLPFVELGRMGIDHLYGYHVEQILKNEFIIEPTAYNKCEAGFIRVKIAFLNKNGHRTLYRIVFIDEDNWADLYTFKSTTHSIGASFFEQYRYKDE